MTEPMPRLSRNKRALFALALVLGPLLLLEFLFRVIGVFGPQEPFGLFRDDRGVELIQYNWNPVKPSFPPEKTGGTLRVMVFGGSSTLGFPYQPRSSFAEMLKVMLEQSLPGLRVEMINLGRVGMNSSEVLELMPRALEYQPDLVIVYSGHNEFISLRNPASVLARLGRWFGSIRVARAAGAGLKIGLGAVMLSVQQKMEEEEPLAPPLPERVTERDFQRVLARYRENLEAMAALCKEKEIPLVLNTLAGNLAGWPPEERAFPKGLSDEARDQAREAVAMAKEVCGQVRARPGQPMPEGEAQAREQLGQAMRQAPGYAPLRFWLARLDLEALIASARLTDPTPDLLAPFNQALSEEAHIVAVHRAPPEINRVVREVAKTKRLMLAEQEWLGITPDIFDDHCHPNLLGQAEIARGIYTTLRDRSFPRPQVEWSPYAFNLKTYLVTQKIDAAFLHNLRVRMGVFLGLDRDLPFHSELTRRQLKEAVATDPGDPLPALLLAAIHLHYGDSVAASADLRPWRKKQDRLRLALDRYFTRSVDLRDGVVYFRLATDPGIPPLRGLLTSGIIDETKPRGRQSELLPRAQFNAHLDLN